MNPMKYLVTDSLVENIDDYDKIITSNPYLIDSYKNKNIIDLDKTTVNQFSFFNSSYDFMLDCFSLFNELGFGHYKSLALMRELQVFEVHTLQAIQLDELCSNGVTHIAFSDNSPNGELSWELYYRSVIRSMEKFNIFTPNSYSKPMKKCLNLSERISNFDKKIRIKHILEKLILKYSKYSPIAKKRIFVRFRNPMLQDIAPELLKHGYYFLDLNLPRITSENISNLTDNSFNEKKLQDLVSSRVTKYVKNSNLKSYLITQFIQRIRLISGLYDQQYSLIKTSLINLKINSSDTIFFNFPGLLHDIALIEFANSQGAKTCSFQHGHGREIMNEDVKKSYTLYENSFTDYVFLYSENSKLHTQKNPFQRNNSNLIVAGVPSAYTIHQDTNNSLENSYLFLSTLLYHGQRHNHHYPSSDHEQSQIELSIIKDVLAQVNHSFIYKSYPEVRYPTPNICIEEVKRHQNIKLVESIIDFRFLKDKFDLVITSRATSTLGWAIFTHKPLVFLDIPGFYKLNDELVESFRNSFFYFSISEKNFLNDLKSFFNQEKSIVLEKWQSMQHHRNIFISTYFGKNINSKEVVNQFLKLRNH